MASGETGVTIIDMQGGYYKASLFNPASQKIFSKGGTGDSQSSGWEGGRNILSPGGAFRPWRDRIGGKTLESGAVARIPQNTLSPTPFRKTESWLRPRKPKNFPTRTDERTHALLCPAMGGTHPLGPAESPPRWQRVQGPMENPPKSPTRLGEDPYFILPSKMLFSPPGGV